MLRDAARTKGLVRSDSRFPVLLFPTLDGDAADHATVVLKATFELVNGKLVEAQEQEPIARSDTFLGAAGESSIDRASDLAPSKPATDVLVRGHAYPERDPTRVQASVSIGNRRADLLVTGDRHWRPAGSGLAPSAPRQFDRMPICYERAFGGPGFDPNPVGCGFGAEQGAPLPNIEDPEAPISQPGQIARTVGLGPIARDWLPRRRFAGTMDAAWRSERAPLLPSDFDDRFHACAHPDLSFSPHLQGGEEAVLTNLSREHHLSFRLPELEVEATATVRSEERELSLVLDTVVIEPDLLRTVLVFRARFPLSRRLVDLRRVDVRAKQRVA